VAQFELRTVLRAFAHVAIIAHFPGRSRVGKIARSVSLLQLTAGDFAHPTARRVERSESHRCDAHGLMGFRPLSRAFTHLTRYDPPDRSN